MPRFHIQRSIDIHADAQRVYDMVADFKTWTTWSPWLICEPQAEIEYSGDTTAVGGQYRWKGELTGQGEIEHLKMHPYQSIENELRFIKPFKSIYRTDFAFSEISGGTKLSWTMQGKMPWYMFWMIPMMKGFISMDYDRGLRMLKDLIELEKISSQVESQGIQEVAPVRMAGVAGSCQLSEMSQAMTKCFEQAQSEFRNAGLNCVGPMISVYTRFQVTKQRFDFVCGYVIPTDQDIGDNQALTTWSDTGGRALVVRHVGAYRHLGNGWSVANQIARYKKMKQKKTGTYEIYRSAPPEVGDDQAVTEIYLPLIG